MREKGSAVRATVDAALAQAGISPSVGLEFSSTEAVKRAVAAGLGISFVPQASLAIERAAKSLVTPPLSGIEIRRRLWLIRAARHRPSPAAEAFMAMIRTD
jgi:DNA-binding transcriptional LysR family regulator